MSVGIGGSPKYLFLLSFVIHFHGEIGILTGITWGDSLIHRLRIDKELEGGAWLTHGSHLVIFPRLEVEVAHPCLYMSSLWLHSNEAAMHEMLHITDRIHGRHLFFDVALFVVEEFNGMRSIQVIVDRILITIILLVEIFVIRQFFGKVFNEVWNLLSTLIAPRIHIQPMVVKTLLDNLHLFDDSLFRILLHTRINGCIDFQTIPVKVNIILIAPFTEVTCYGITVIERLSVVVVLHTIV